MQDSIGELKTDVLSMIEVDATFSISGKTSMAMDVGKVVAEKDG